MSVLNRRNKLLATAINSGGGGELPPEYQRVEYIESTGTQYIDTGISTSDISESSERREFIISIDFSITSGGINQGVIGAYEAGANQRYLAYISTSNMLQFRALGINQNIETISVGTKYKVDIELLNGYQSYSLNGEEKYVWSNTLSNNTTTHYLFALHDLTEPSKVYARSKSRIYFCSYKLADGTPYKTFIPCYRKADGEIGMYDVVNGEFLTNIGTETFLKGDDVK